MNQEQMSCPCQLITFPFAIILWVLLCRQVPDNVYNANLMSCTVFLKFKIAFLEIVMRSDKM